MSLSKGFGLTKLFAKYPIAKGMVSYAIIWPVSSIIQQTIEGRRYGTYDLGRCLRFSLYGSLFVAPTLYGWVRLTSVIWPQMNLRTAVTKALVEQVSYGPLAMACFFFGMSLLEFSTLEEAIEEVKAKFWPTYKVGLCVWPILQTINFSMIAESNRVPFVSACSFVWTIYLAYMKQSKHHTELRNQQKMIKPENVAFINSSMS